MIDWEILKKRDSAVATGMSGNNNTNSCGQQPVIELDVGWSNINTNGILRLQRIIQGGLKESFSNQEYLNLYNTVYQMCIQKPPNCFTTQLYDRFEQSVCKYFDEVSEPAIAAKQGDYMVKELVKRWEDYLLFQKWMCDFFAYLNRFFVKRFSKPALKDVFLNRFRSIVFDKEKHRASTAIRALIRRDRCSEDVDRDLIRDAIKIFVEMGEGFHNKVYKDDFEAKFLVETAEFYSYESAKWLEADSCPEFLRKAEVRLDEEEKRLKSYLHPSTREKLTVVLQQSMLIQHLHAVLAKEQTGYTVMLQNNMKAELFRLYKIYTGIPACLLHIAKGLEEHIVEVGVALLDKLQAMKDFSTYIEKLMAIHSQFYDLVIHCFRGDTEFHKALKDAFELVVNRKTEGAVPAELLVDYCDQLLRKGGIRLTEKALEVELDKVVQLFQYMIDKDLFSEFYRKQLAKRLLLQRSNSSDAEKIMIGKLKLRCGAQFTSKLEGMMNDMRMSTEYHTTFRDWLRERKNDINGIDMTVQTLTTGFWPSYPSDEVKLPPVMDVCIDAFRMFYHSKTSNRKLKFVHNLGVVTLKAQISTQILELTVSGVQAALLLILNDTPELDIESLTARAGLQADAIKRQLKTLVSGPFKILLKHPVEGYQTNHIIKVNKAFRSPNLRIRIPSAAAKVTSQERQVSQLAVSEDRKHAIEASIVRVMKARKSLDHNKLMMEVSAQLMQFFQPDPKQIKKRIEDLIGREYLKRDEDQNNLYHYVAS